MSKKANIFRGKSVDRGQWIYGANLSLDGKEYILPAAKENIVNFNNNSFFVRAIEVEPETLGQHINFYDQNGEGIYEGDLILLSGAREPEPVCEVIYDYEYCGYFFKKTEEDEMLLLISFLEQDEVLIVGNIHEPKKSEGGSHDSRG